MTFPEQAFLLGVKSIAIEQQEELFFWVTYRGHEDPCLQLMLLPKGAQESAPRAFSKYARRYKIDLSMNATKLLAEVRGKAQSERGGWTSWTVALVTAWAAAVKLDAVETIHFTGLSSTERATLFGGKGKLSAILATTRQVSPSLAD